MLELFAGSNPERNVVGVKAIPVQEAQGQLGQLIAKACRGDLIVLTDGGREVTLEPRGLDLEEDSPQLESELLKAVNGPHHPLQENDLREIASRALREKLARPHP